MDTRTAILEKNFQSIYQNGFQGTRTDKVIAELGITKGAFYHYFPDKLSMGYAIVDEILYPMYVSKWLHLENYEDHMIDGIIEGIEQIRNIATPDNIGMGCPLNNLIQEMSAIDNSFQQKLAKIVNKCISLVENAILKGQQKQQIIPTVDANALAHFLWANIEGSFAVGKSKQSCEAFNLSINYMIQHLLSLKL